MARCRDAVIHPSGGQRRPRHSVRCSSWPFASSQPSTARYAPASTPPPSCDRKIVDGIRERTPERRFLTHAEVAALADACAPYGAAVQVLAYCGLRFGELAALRVHRIDLVRRRLEITESVTEVEGRAIFGTPKSHRRRSVPVPGFLVDDLTRQIEGKAHTPFSAVKTSSSDCSDWSTSAGAASTPQRLRWDSKGSHSMSCGTRRRGSP